MCVPAMKASSSVSRTSRWRRKVKRCFTLRTFISRMMWWVASSNYRICCLTRRLTDAVGQPAGLRLLPALPADCYVGAGHARESRLGARAWPAYASPLGWLSRHCVTAYAGLRPCAPVQGEVSPCEPLWPAFQLYPRLPNPIEHTRPRGIHAPTRSFGIIQTMLLALPNVGLERMGRKNSGGYAGMALLSALRAQKQKQKPKTKNQKPKENIRPQAAKNDSGCCGFPGPFGPARR